jgi:hypothetical protein
MSIGDWAKYAIEMPLPPLTIQSMIGGTDVSVIANKIMIGIAFFHVGRAYCNNNIKATLTEVKNK